MDVLWQVKFKSICGSGEEDENVKTLQTNEQTDRWTDGYAKAETERKSEREKESVRESRNGQRELKKRGILKIVRER